jgi:hypothetical protein
MAISSGTAGGLPTIVRACSSSRSGWGPDAIPRCIGIDDAYPRHVDVRAKLPLVN